MSEKSNVPIISKQEMSKVENNMLNVGQLNYLLQRTPENHIYERPGKGGGKWKYVTGVYVKKVLNLMFGWDWSFEVIKHEFDLNIKQAYVLGKLTVNSGGKSITKMQFGRVEIKFKTEWIDGKKTVTNQPLDIGNDLKAATTDALKKCASELGIASDVYAPNEFKEIQIIDKEDIDYKKEIENLLEDDNIKISETDRMYIQRILEDKEVESYAKILKMYKK